MATSFYVNAKRIQDCYDCKTFRMSPVASRVYVALPLGYDAVIIGDEIEIRNFCLVSMQTFVPHRIKLPIEVVAFNRQFEQWVNGKALKPGEITFQLPIKIEAHKVIFENEQGAA